MNNYEQEFQVYASNINQVARSFYYHKEIQQQVYEDGVKHQELPEGHFQDSEMFQAMNANAQFWSDYKSSSLFYSIVILGRIFDKDKSSHGIKRLVKTARNSKLFTKEKLRERKISGSENAHEWIETYMQSLTDITPSEYCSFLCYLRETQRLWNDIKGVRNKLYAHQDAISSEKKHAILEKATYDTIEQIIQRLLTVEAILFDAYNNGRKPDFEYVDTKIHSRVKSDVSSLLSRLSQENQQDN
jgi:hypothetical protein